MPQKAVRLGAKKKTWARTRKAYRWRQYQGGGFFCVVFRFTRKTQEVAIKMLSPHIHTLLFLIILVQYVTAWPIRLKQKVLGPSLVLPSEHNAMFTLPVHDPSPWDRIKEIQWAREGYKYGPSLLGNTSYFPTGAIGDAMAARDEAEWYRDAEYVTNNVYPDIKEAATAIAKVS